MGNIIHFFPGYVLQLLALGGQLFVDLDGLFGHDLMGLLRTADQGEIWTLSDSLLTVGIKADPNHHRFGLFFPALTRHGGNLSVLGPVVKFQNGFCVHWFMQEWLAQPRLQHQSDGNRGPETDRSVARG